MSELHSELSHDEQLDAKQDKAPPKVERPETQAVRAMLERGVSDPSAYATYLAAHPAARDEILAVLNQSLGNGFVMQVADALNAKAGRGKPPSKKDRDEAMADFAEVNGGPSAAPVVGKPPSKKDRDEAMADFAEINGGPSPKAAAPVVGKPPSKK